MILILRYFIINSGFILCLQQRLQRQIFKFPKKNPNNRFFSKYVQIRPDFWTLFSSNLVTNMEQNAVAPLGHLQ